MVLVTLLLPLYTFRDNGVRAIHDTKRKKLLRVVNVDEKKPTDSSEWGGVSLNIYPTVLFKTKTGKRARESCVPCPRVGRGADPAQENVDPGKRPVTRPKAGPEGGPGTPQKCKPLANGEVAKISLEFSSEKSKRLAAKNSL